MRPWLRAHFIFSNHRRRGYESMRLQCLVCLLFASIACGQAAPPAPAPATGAQAGTIGSTATDQAPEVKVGPDDPVITVNHFCTGPGQSGDVCKTVITRAQFEKL